MTPAPGAGAPIGARRVLAIALPVALSNVTVPLQGAVDVAVIGSLGSETPLAAVGLGAIIFSLLFGVFNFLQIGTSGLSAQALGARDPQRAIDTLARALVVALAIAAAMLAGQGALRWAGLVLFDASAEAEALAGLYFDWRIWGAPAELANYALVGWFAGQEMTRRLFQHQLVLSLTNIALNVSLVLGFGWGVEGVALGTALASWLGLGYGLWMARGRARALAPQGWRFEAARVLTRAALVGVMALNRDILMRTLLLIGAFAWMTRLGAQQGDAILAANVVLWQFFEVSAYALDGFAIAAESLVGQAYGARDPRALRRAVVATSLWSALLAVAASAALLALSGPIVDLLTTAPEVRALARVYAPWAALTPLVGFAAFQLDGVFIGAAAGSAMRNAMILSAAVYFPLSWAAAAQFGNHGVWAAMHAFLALRAVTLLLRYPALERQAAHAGVAGPQAGR